MSATTDLLKAQLQVLTDNMQNMITALEANDCCEQLAAANQEIANLQAQIDDLNQQIDDLATQIDLATSLNNQLQDIINQMQNCCGSSSGSTSGTTQFPDTLLLECSPLTTELQGTTTITLTAQNGTLPDGIYDVNVWFDGTFQGGAWNTWIWNNTTDAMWVNGQFQQALNYFDAGGTMYVVTTWNGNVITSNVVTLTV